MSTCVEKDPAPRSPSSPLWALLLLVATPPVLPAQNVPTLQLEPADAVLDRGFTIVTSVRELADGRLLVADYGENQLYLGDFRSEEVTHVGREGEGPGEYMHVGWIYPLGGDSTLFTDSTLRRWSLLDGTGFVETIARSELLPRTLGPSLGGANASGKVLGTGHHRGTYNAPDTLVLLLADRGEGAVDTVCFLKGPGEFGKNVSLPAGRGSTIFPHPLYTSEQGLLFPDGWLAVARMGSFRVDWRAPDGRWARGAALPFPSILVDDRERRFHLARYTTREIPARFEWPDELPPFLSYTRSPRGNAAGTSTLFATPEGNLLIRRTESAAEPGTDYVLVDRGGVAVGVLSLQSNEAIVGFGARSVYVLATDDWDLQRLRRHPWPL